MSKLLFAGLAFGAGIVMAAWNCAAKKGDKTWFKAAPARFDDWWNALDKNVDNELPAFLLTKLSSAEYILKHRRPVEDADFCYKVWKSARNDQIFVAMFSKENGDVVLSYEDGVFQLFSLDGEGHMFFESDSPDLKDFIMMPWLKEMLR